MSRATEAWKTEVLYLAGMSIDEIARALYGTTDRRGPVNRIVTSKKLVAARKGPERARRLVELDRAAPTGMAGFVDEVVNGFAVRAGMLLAADRTHRSIMLDRTMQRSELKTRVGLPSMIDALREVKSEVAFIPQKRARGDLIVNIANCPLELLNARRLLPEWAYQAGLCLRRDFNMASVGQLRSVDTSREAVDGGRGGGHSDSALDAMRRYQEARSAVAYVFSADTAQRWAIIEQVAVIGNRIGDYLAASKAAIGMASAFLTDALEPVAYIYDLAPAGHVADVLQAWQMPRAKSDMGSEKVEILQDQATPNAQ